MHATVSIARSNGESRLFADPLSPQLRAFLVIGAAFVLFFRNESLPQLDKYRPKICPQNELGNQFAFLHHSVEPFQPKVCVLGRIYVVFIMMVLAASTWAPRRFHLGGAVNVLFIVGFAASLLLNWNAAAYFFVLLCLYVALDTSVAGDA